MKYYKILNERECHNGLQYKTGLNVDPVPFNPNGNCEPGGIYFAREDILFFLCYGPWIREVVLPDDARVYENPFSPKKWKADKVILRRRRRITTKVVNELIAEGAVDAFSQMDGSDWSRLLQEQPQFAEHCDWWRLDGRDWRWLLREQPQLAEHCDWSKMDGSDWSCLLRKQPQFAEHCDWSKLNDLDWHYLLQEQPRFKKYMEKK